MITGMRVKNLRAIFDSQHISFRRINILVGRNSAGKSTILRILPLLRQSVEQRTKGPILWFGRFVDFGTFRNAIRSSLSDDECISFEFEVRLDPKRRGTRTPNRIAPGLLINKPFVTRQPITVNVSFSLGIGSKDSYGNIKELRLKFPEDLAVFKFDGANEISSIEVNGQDIRLKSGQRWMVNQGKLLPIIHVLRLQDFTDGNGQKQQFYSYDEQAFGGQILQNTMRLMHGNANQAGVKNVLGGISYAPQDDFFRQLNELVGLPPTFYEKLSVEGEAGEQVSKIRMWSLLSSISGILSEIDGEINEFASGVRYIEPLRASAERYYRLQDLAVDEIDSRGANVPMFLNSLNFYEKNNLQKWMQKSFGFHARVNQTSGHVQVEIVGNGGMANNIADLGFGFSQLLPILLQIWRSMVALPNDAIKKQPIIAVEQPELHLHPQYQSLLADVLASVISSSDTKGSIFFMETHSEHLINRLGELVASKKLSAADVQIIVVEQGDDRITEVRPVEFSDLGYLGEGWPTGFFVPRAN